MVGFLSNSAFELGTSAGKKRSVRMKIISILVFMPVPFDIILGCII